MEAYRRLAAVTTSDDVDDVLAEWTDRYGPPPPPAAVLLDVARLRAECLRLGIRAVSVQKGRARFDGWELRKSQEARLKRLSDRSQVLPDAVIVPVSATADVSLPQALLRLLREIAQRRPGTIHRMRRFLSLLVAAVVDRARSVPRARAHSPTPPPSTTRRRASRTSDVRDTRRPAERGAEDRRQQAVRDVAQAEQVHSQFQHLDRHRVSARSGFRSSFTSRPSTASFASRHITVTPAIRRAGREGRREHLPDGRHLPGVRLEVPGRR